MFALRIISFSPTLPSSFSLHLSLVIPSSYTSPLTIFLLLSLPLLISFLVHHVPFSRDFVCFYSFPAEFSPTDHSTSHSFPCRHFILVCLSCYIKRSFPLWYPRFPLFSFLFLHHTYLFLLLLASLVSHYTPTTMIISFLLSYVLLRVLPYYVHVLFSSTFSFLVPSYTAALSPSYILISSSSSHMCTNADLPIVISSCHAIPTRLILYITISIKFPYLYFIPVLSFTFVTLFQKHTFYLSLSFCPFQLHISPLVPQLYCISSS